MGYSEDKRKDRSGNKERDLEITLICLTPFIPECPRAELGYQDGDW